MAETNGSPVTRAELAAHVKGIDASFESVKEDINEIRLSIEGIYQTFRADRKDRAGRWLAWGPPMIAALIAVAVAVPVAMFAH